jgi:hypothetical protein
LTTRFCEIRCPKPAPDKAFGGIERKKYLPEIRQGYQKLSSQDAHQNFILVQKSTTKVV